jgi:hypothetical protein
MLHTRMIVVPVALAVGLSSCVVAVAPVPGADRSGSVETRRRYRPVAPWETSESTPVALTHARSFGTRSSVSAVTSAWLATDRRGLPLKGLPTVVPSRCDASRADFYIDGRVRERRVVTRRGRRVHGKSGSWRRGLPPSDSEPVLDPRHCGHSTLERLHSCSRIPARACPCRTERYLAVSYTKCRLI